MKAKILPITPENLSIAAEAILNDEVVGMPTETVYGLAGNCLSIAALTRIFRTKDRPTFDPLIIHIGFLGSGVAELSRLELIDPKQMTDDQKTLVDKLINAFWPGPLTLVLPKNPKIHDLATSGLPTVALRMPKHPVAQMLIAAAGVPLAAPSANRFGRISPTTAQAVQEELGDRIEWILDGGKSEIGLESTVMAFNPQGELVILRPGGITPEQIREVVNQEVAFAVPRSSDNMPSPGMCESHYAPKKPLHLLATSLALLTETDIAKIKEKILSDPIDQPIGLLTLKGDPELQAEALSRRIHRPVIAKSLSISGDLTEMSRNLFESMRWLDSSAASTLFSEPCDLAQGLGFAISDRLKRASAKNLC